VYITDVTVLGVLFLFLIYSLKVTVYVYIQKSRSYM